MSSGSESGAAPEPFPWRWVIGFTLAALAIRVYYVGWIHPVAKYIYSDMYGFYSEAVVWANPDHVADKWDAARPWTLGRLGGIIFQIFKSDGVPAWGYAQAVVSAAAVPLTAIGAHRFLGRKAAVIAAALLTVDPLAIAFSGYIMTETYLMTCFAFALAFLDPTRPLRCILAGVGLGLGALFKAQALPLAVAWGAVCVLWPTPTAARGLVGWLRAPPRIAAALMAIGTAAVMAPQAISLSRILHKPTLFAPYGGQNFYLGHCGVKLLTLDGGKEGGMLLSLSAKAVELNAPWPDVTFHVSVFDSAFYVREGWKCVRRSFAHTLSWGAEQLFDVLAGVPGATLDPWPVRMDQPHLARRTNFLVSYLLVPLALVGLWRRRRQIGGWLAIGCPLIGGVWGLALLFSGNPRYREPFDLFIIVGAAAGIVALLEAYGARAPRTDAVEPTVAQPS